MIGWTKKVNYILINLKHHWRFKFAHKPLCNHYKSGVFSFKNIHICKSCSLAYIAIFLSLFFPMIDNLQFLILTFVVFIFSLPKIYENFPRHLKNVLRFLSGLVLGLSFKYLIMGNVLGLIGFSLAVLYRVLSAKSRSTKKQKICHNCDERNLGICSGFQLQAQAFRNFEEEYYQKFLVHEGVKKC